MKNGHRKRRFYDRLSFYAHFSAFQQRNKLEYRNLASGYKKRAVQQRKIANCNSPFFYPAPRLMAHLRCAPHATYRRLSCLMAL